MTGRGEAGGRVVHPSKARGHGRRRLAEVAVHPGDGGGQAAKMASRRKVGAGGVAVCSGEEGRGWEAGGMSVWGGMERRAAEVRGGDERRQTKWSSVWGKGNGMLLSGPFVQSGVGSDRGDRLIKGERRWATRTG
ncbi:uncharacterized protein DS421_10g307810 [Arachis hypogaea]|nr:uncharacterized protein DS421_10g307810 [Arachis hypogaea]